MSRPFGESNLTDEALLAAFLCAKELMTSVSTGGPDIKSVNDQYKALYLQIERSLHQHSISNPNPFRDLWEWFGHWSSGDLPSWQSRRKYISEMFGPTMNQVREHSSGTVSVAAVITGWTKVDRTIQEIRARLEKAVNEEQFQAVGLLCREALISLGQSVYDSSKHKPVDDKTPSDTDAKRMLEAYIATELDGSSNEVLRKYSRTSVDLAVELQHRRTADFRKAALCAEATTAVVNLVAIVSGRRDP